MKKSNEGLQTWELQMRQLQIKAAMLKTRVEHRVGKF